MILTSENMGPGLQTDQIVSRITSISGQGKRVVFVFGNFNVVHPGSFEIASVCG